MRSIDNAKRRIIAQLRKIEFIFVRHGSREVVRRTLLKAGAQLRALGGAWARNRVWRKRAQLLRVRVGGLRGSPRADAEVRIFLYAAGSPSALQTSLYWLCQLRMPVTVLEDLSHGFFAAVAQAALACEEPFVVAVPAGFVPMPGWLETLRSTLGDSVVAAAPLVFDARKQPLTIEGDTEDPAFRYRRTARRVPVAGSLIRREVAAALHGDQAALTSDAGDLIFAPAAVAVDLGSLRPYTQIAFLRAARSVAFFDAHAPYYDREGGGHRMWHLLEIARKVGWHTVFVPMDGSIPEPYLTQLRQRGIEALYPHSAEPLERLVRRRAVEFDVAWFSRPAVAATLAPIVRDANPSVGILYDTVDLHHVRLQRRAELLADEDDWTSVRETEFGLARQADAVVAVTADEKDALERAGARNVFVVPTLHERVEHDPVPFDERRGLLFIGSYDHEPNVDAALYLCQRIMPLIWKRLPDVRLTLLGSNPPPRVRALRSKTVSVPGYVPNVGGFFESARVFVAPLRYGAGMKAKLTQALAYGLPTVTTPSGAEGVQERRALVVTDDDRAFADAVVRLYTDAASWQLLSAAARDAAVFYEPANFCAQVSSILETCAALGSGRSNAGAGAI